MVADADRGWSGAPGGSNASCSHRGIGCSSAESTKFHCLSVVKTVEVFNVGPELVGFVVRHVLISSLATGSYNDGKIAAGGNCLLEGFVCC